MSKLTCRYYKQILPELDDVVTVKVRSISNLGAYVNLLEYDDQEGMILMTELSRKRIRSINKLIRVGKIETVVVIRLDDDRDYVDLSKRRIAPEDVKKGEDRYIRAKTVYHILQHCAEVMGMKTKEEFEHLMKETAWRFHEEYKNKGGAYEAFEKMVENASVLDPCDLTIEQKQIILAAVRHRLEPRIAKIRADVEVSFCGEEGIDAVKSALRRGIEYSKTTTTPIKIGLITPPVYMISAMILDRREGLAMMHQVVSLIKEEILSKDGSFSLRMAPKIMNEIDQEKMKRQIEELQKAKEEIESDEDEDDSSDDSDVEGEILKNAADGGLLKGDKALSERLAKERSTHKDSLKAKSRDEDVSEENSNAEE